MKESLKEKYNDNKRNNDIGKCKRGGSRTTRKRTRATAATTTTMTTMEMLERITVKTKKCKPVDRQRGH